MTAGRKGPFGRSSRVPAWALSRLGVGRQLRSQCCWGGSASLPTAEARSSVGSGKPKQCPPLALEAMATGPWPAGWRGGTLMPGHPALRCAAAGGRQIRTWWLRGSGG